MRVIVAGSRSITNPVLVWQVIHDSKFPITELVCGMAPGPDLIAWEWAKETGIPVQLFEAKWRIYGNAAGMIRNEDMAQYASEDPEGGGLIAIWDGVSRGTADMIRRAYAKHLKWYIHHSKGRIKPQRWPELRVSE